MTNLYILVDGEVVPEPDVIAWAMWYEWHTEDRIVAKDYIGKDRVSTVFLGVDHNFLGDGDPILFETMIFEGPHTDEQWRYRTLDEAKAGHAKVVADLRAQAAAPDGSEAK